MPTHPTDLTPDERALQAEVRAFLAAELPPGSYRPGLGMVGGRDPEFSRKLGARGWLGMALPRRYGGGERTAVERFVITEELLRHGAPVEHHWNADRQTGPVLARFGTDEQKARFLPGICRGELSFAIGMSEPDAGSDLAAVRTRATRTTGGWLLNGTKVWTSGAHVSDWFIVLCRTSDEPERHAGLSRLIVDLRADGVQVNPIVFIDGTSEFNEVVLRDVFVPDELMIGEPGEGWAQNSSELVYERGGPERWLSPYLVIEEYLRSSAGDDPDDDILELLGDAEAQWWCLRRMSLEVARLLDLGEAPAMQSALVKDAATRFEQELIEAAQLRLPVDLTGQTTSAFSSLLFRATLTGPSFTIRGGTTEVLRSVMAKGLR